MQYLTYAIPVAIILGVWGYACYLGACRPFDTTDEGDMLSREWTADIERRSAQTNHWQRGDVE